MTLLYIIGRFSAPSSHFESVHWESHVSLCDIRNQLTNDVFQLKEPEVQPKRKAKTITFELNGKLSTIIY